MDRRNFLRNAALLASANLFSATGLFAKKVGEFGGLGEAFARLGFSPDAKGSWYFAAMGDPHLHAQNPENTALFKRIADELKTLKPAPKFLAMLGDLISNGNSCFGSISTNHNMAIREIEILRECVDYLKPIEPKLVLGNHDTVAPDDFDNVLYKKHMPELAPYYFFEEGGMAFVVLNGGHTTLFDENQKKWFLERLAKLGGKNLTVFVHQPAGRVNTEYEASGFLRDALDSYKGNARIICGHIHYNKQWLFETPSGKNILQFSLEAPRKNKAPVYWLFCVKGGDICGAVFRNKDGKFEAFDFKFKPQKWEMPFESRGVKAWFNAMSPEFREERLKGWFNGSKCLYFYYYLKHLEFSLDLSKVGDCSKLVLLASRLSGKRGKAKFAVSADGSSWAPIEPAKTEPPYFEFDLPENLRSAKRLYVSISTGDIEANFGGAGVK